MGLFTCCVDVLLSQHYRLQSLNAAAASINNETYILDEVFSQA